MKRSVCMLALGVLLSSVFVTALDAWARAGGGGSSGSRGSRSYSAPARPSTSPSTLAPRPTPPTSYAQQTPPQRSGWMSGIMGGIGGLFLGGLIGSMLFGGLGHGFGGGIGFLEILIVGGLVFFALSYLRRRQTAAPAGYAPPGYAPAGHPTQAPEWQPEPASRATAVIDAPAPSDLDRGIGHVRQMDAAFTPEHLTETASDMFFKVQAGWMARDMGSVRDLLTPEMYVTLQRDCDRLRAERRINRLESVAVRSVDLTEIWQESGRDFATVRFLASLLDYTTDEAGQVIDGSRTEPVKFEEFWTFARPVGPQPWRLSAIQQAA